MHKARRAVGVAFCALTLALGAGLATPASAATAGRPVEAPAAQQDLEWRLQNIYATYDDCYWAGFDGWNTYQWDHWRCPQILGTYWLMVADN
ncbi:MULTISPECIES: hypothetical protein [unclassified Amycolatopsis]|uniref:hypothetical protein n=1 Tax=unclassified Amycolatopsis TaxID=2618356 RepID=UPI0028761E28|nr:MULTISPECIES: hypothetical protein [unclassified Amycolatopsis]MDS0140120.1 hypothetical protein [Amycolatopsis sp. 505]MDS0148674.1 hypothetical protein [Amycolatopsis sp. CM201R]